MTLHAGGPYAAMAWMDDYDIIPPPDPTPIPTPPQHLAEDEDDLMLIGSIGYKMVATGAETKTQTVPRTEDASANTVSRSRYDVAQIDVELSAAGVVEVYWNSETTKKVYIITGRRQLMQVPNGATLFSAIFPGAGTITLTFGRTE